MLYVLRDKESKHYYGGTVATEGGDRVTVTKTVESLEDAILFRLDIRSEGMSSNYGTRVFAPDIHPVGNWEVVPVTVREMY